MTATVLKFPTQPLKETLIKSLRLEELKNAIKASTSLEALHDMAGEVAIFALYDGGIHRLYLEKHAELNKPKRGVLLRLGKWKPI